MRRLPAYERLMVEETVGPGIYVTYDRVDAEGWHGQQVVEVGRPTTLWRAYERRVDVDIDGEPVDSGWVRGLLVRPSLLGRLFERVGATVPAARTVSR